jgi:hypothetical protein
MAERVVAPPSSNERLEVQAESWEGEFEVLPVNRAADWRGTPIIDQFRLDYFLKLMQDDADSWDCPLPIEGRLYQLSAYGEIEWTLKLTVPISNTMGDYLFCMLEDIN